MERAGTTTMETTQQTLVTGTRPPARVRYPAPATDLQVDLASSPETVARTDDDDFCPECGQPLVGTVRLPTWAVSASPWWAWALIALGAALTIVFGATAWSAAQ